MMTDKAETIRCDNAGLVLLHSYFPLLFTHLGLIEGRHFTAPDDAARAIAALHRLATGLDQSGDTDPLPLCKLLTGIPLETQLPGAELNDEQHRLCDSLLEAAIGHWPAIGQQSLDGFRGNFLRRNGMLARGEDRWKLTVEKRSYDVLIARAPFSFALVHHPWMRQPIHVTWPM